MLADTFLQVYRFWARSSSNKNIGPDRNYDISGVRERAVNRACTVNRADIIDRQCCNTEIASHSHGLLVSLNSG